MEKVNKMKMFYNLTNAKGIQIMVPPPTTTAHAPSLTSISATETSTFAPNVDKFVDVATTLTVGICLLLQFQQRGSVMKINNPLRNRVL